MPCYAHIMYPDSFIERFFENVGEPTESGCMEWQGPINAGGYGLMWRGRERYAHRHSYIIKHGSIPPGACVRHTCDNKKCVNPDHLLLGSRRDNTKDALDRGLLCRGSKRRPDLTEAAVFDARVAFHKQAKSLSSLSRALNMCLSQTSDVLWGRLWCHVPMPEGVEARPRRRPLKKDLRNDR